MSKTTLRMLSLLTAFVMTFTSVDMAAFAAESTPEEVVVTAETTVASTVSIEEDSTEAEEVTSVEGRTTEEADSEEMTTTETEEETSTEETTTEELMLEEDGRYSEKLTDAVTLVQSTYYQNENGNYDIFIATCVPGVTKDGSYSVKIYVDDVEYPYNWDDKDGIFKYTTGYSGNTNLCAVRIELRNIPLSVGEHSFKAEIDCSNRTSENSWEYVKSGYIEGTLNLSSERDERSKYEAINTTSIYSKDSVSAYISAMFELDNGDSIVADKANIPVLVSTTDSEVRVPLVKHSIYNSYSSDYLDIRNSNYVYEMKVGEETLVIPEKKQVLVFIQK